MCLGELVPQVSSRGGSHKLEKSALESVLRGYSRAMKRSMFSIALFLLDVAAVSGYLFPKECCDRYTGEKIPCCPDYNGTPCGIGERRGECRQPVTSRMEPAPDVMVDERNGFPGGTFNWTCQCKDRFFGSDCGECAPGWTGPNCDEKVMVIRRSLLSLSPSELHRYHAMLSYCKQQIDPKYVIMQAGDRLRARSRSFKPCSYYDMCIYAHYYATKPFVSNGREIDFTNYAHGSTGFMTWHRHMILMCERQLQRCMQDPTIAIHYYPWELSRECLVCDDLHLGKTGFDGRLSEFSIYSTWRLMCGTDYSQSLCMMEDCPCERPRIFRLPGLSNVVTLPPLSEFNRCMNMSTFDRAPYDTSIRDCFRNCMEGVHNTFHVYINGLMAEVPLSANDPMFFAHHCNIDRWFEMYIVKYNMTPASYPPCNVYGHTPTSCVTPAYNCMRNREFMRPISYFGVTFI